MSLSYSDIVAVSVSDARAELLGYLDDIGFEATSWQEGSVPLAMVEIGALVYSKGTEVGAAIKTFFFNSTATGDSLTLFSDSHYDNQRVSAVAAQYSIKLTSSAAAPPHTFDIGDVVVSDGQYNYTNVADGTTVYPYTLATGGNVTLLFEAEIPGEDSSVAAASIDQLISSYAGVSLSDQARVTIGTNEESDSVLRRRNTTKWPTLNLTEPISEAIENVALNSDDTITRATVDDSNPRGPGTFDTYVATNTGGASVPAVSAAQAAIEVKVFGGSSTAQVYSATAVSMNIVGTVYYTPGINAGDVQAAVEERVDTWLGELPIGGQDVATGLTGVVSLNELEHQIRSTQVAGADAVRGVTLTNPTTDFTVGPFEVAVVGVYNITYTAANQ